MLLGYVPHSNCIFLSNIETSNMSQVSQNVKECENITELTQCGVLTTVTHISSSTIPSLTSSISSSVITVTPSTSSGTNLLIIIISSSVGGVIYILIAVVVTILVIVVIKVKRQKTPDKTTPTGPPRDTANSCTNADINREDIFGASYSYDVCVETKRNFSYGIIVPHQLNNISTRETDSSLNASYQVPQPYESPQQSSPDL